MGNLEQMTLDDALDNLQAMVSVLTLPKTAAFYSISANALLPLYEGFYAKYKWGDPDALRQAIDLASEWATGSGDSSQAPGLLRAVEAATPNGEKFDSPDSTFAQDVTICVDAALRACLPNAKLNSAWIEYVIEPATVRACLDETGYTDLGTSEEATAWRHQALKNRELRRAVESCLRMLDILASRSELHTSDLDELKSVSSGLLASSSAGGGHR